MKAARARAHKERRAVQNAMEVAAKGTDVDALRKAIREAEAAGVGGERRRRRGTAGSVGAEGGGAEGESGGGGEGEARGGGEGEARGGGEGEGQGGE